MSSSRFRSRRRRRTDRHLQGIPATGKDTIDGELIGIVRGNPHPRAVNLVGNFKDAEIVPLPALVCAIHFPRGGT
jgi:hypothetical protein